MVARSLIISDRLESYGTLQEQLQKYPDSEVWVVEARDLRFFVQEKYENSPDLVLLDISASPSKCLAATARVRALFPSAKLAVRADASWKGFGYLAMQAGAHGVIDASTYSCKHDLSMLIESIMAGNLIYRTEIDI